MINQSNLDGFLNLGDEQLLKRIRDAAIAAGADENKVKTMLSNPERLKNIVASLTPEQAQRLISMFGKDKADIIADSLKKDL